MKKIKTIIFLVGITTVCFAQVDDDFSDGDFSNSPTWLGSVSQFVVNTANQLQLNNTVAGTSYLSTAFSSASLDNFQWLFYVKQSFSSSANNFGRVYLTSDQADLTQPLNGYYLQFGEAGSNDAIELFRQTGNISTSVCRGTAGGVANSFAVNIKITRDGNGLWSLNVDYSGGNSFVLDASGTDLTYNSSLYFGVLCTYTVSNSTKFYYDNFYAGPPQTDKTPPAVQTVQVASSSTISIVFDELLDPVSSQSTANYEVSNTIGNPNSVSLQPDGKSVILNFTKIFSNGIQNQITVSGVKDLAGNAMNSSSLAFLFFQSMPALSKDIIFTEIFPDPSPQVGLPAQEYVEVYNRSTNPFNLSGWKFSDGTSTAVLGSQIILPQEYWIVVASANVNIFNGYGRAIGVPNFPTLNNSGDHLTLRDPSNTTIDSVNYTLAWYHDIDKQEGGWSIEIIDPKNVCSEQDNWAASENPSGGTPGKQNSIFANKPDLIGPQLVAISPLSPTILKMNFNEKLEKDLSPAEFTITPSIPIAKSYFTDITLQQITIELTQALALRELYAIEVNKLYDCSGNLVQPNFNKLSFALPEKADSLDLVINEILFNPRAGGVDFLEVYNQSPKYINLKNWQLGNFEGNTFINAKAITTDDFILTPKAYCVFASFPDLLTNQYPQAISKNLLKASLPTLPNDQGTIALQNDQSLVIDHFSYSQKMHSPFLKDNEGISLERISFSELTNDPSNWRSASSTAGFATPGYVNSNSRPESSINDNAITLDPQIFSPSVPGRDFSKINYKFDQGGKVANVKILDAEGRLIKTLANNETLGLEGFYRWDGDRDDGSRARMGYYVVWFEVFDDTGSVNVYRKRAVIGK